MRKMRKTIATCGCTTGIVALIFIFFIHMSVIIDVNGLKCYCDICTESNHTCETDGYCFASTTRDDDDVITYAHRCLDRKNWFPPESPLVCKPNNYQSGACCDQEYCNLNLYPVLQTFNVHKLRKGILPSCREFFTTVLFVRHYEM
ncbi:hypothetical protein PV327_003990 [Microctonus hyperodae]|uniref:Activin types I and II receptor domain-containing protein n=1 Tax=Microctonus hyperodae TaxID=165561 RepID=A0AA39L1L9_MICHY|nr:hypothetical protein PV327_003990 [Microctonus hyperodae]